jgi:hypothetical protein
MIKSNDDTEATLKTELMKFSTLASDPEIQEAHQHVTMKAVGTECPASLEQICPTKVSDPKVGEHWKKLGACCAATITTFHCSSMDKSFIVAVGFPWDAGGPSTSMWSGEMDEFGFGRTQRTEDI